MIDYDMIRVAGDVNVDLSLRQVSPTDSYILREAEGLTAPEFNMQIAETLYQGGVFQNRQSLNRQVVLNIRLNPNYGAGETVKSLRQNLYKMLSPRFGRSIKVQIMLAGIVVAEVEGYVSGMPMNPFVKDPEVQVTIDCLSPLLKAPTPVNFVPNAARPVEITYPGSAPVGFMIQMQYKETNGSGGFSMSNSQYDPLKIQSYHSFITNDILTIDTRPGSRSMTRTRGGTTVSVLADMFVDSSWLELYEGINYFNVSSLVDVIGVTYTPQWWGV